MDLSLEFAQARVYDDVLPPDAFEQLWQLMDSLPYERTDSAIWTKAWSIADGAILRGPQWLANTPDWTVNPPPPPPNVQSFPVNPPALAALLGKVREACAANYLPGVNGIAMLPYVWPPGRSIAWHADGMPANSGRVGAFTFYVHKTWNIEWGGEFLISDIDADAEGISSAPSFDNSELSERIMSDGFGTWVAPKPNRLVINPSNMLHKVTKTTAAAAPRMSIQGFLFVR